MINCNYNSNISFGMHCNKKSVQRVLKNMDPEKKKEICDGISSFCNQTQRDGIKGTINLTKAGTGLFRKNKTPHHRYEKPETYQYDYVKLNMRFPDGKSAGKLFLLSGSSNWTQKGVVSDLYGQLHAAQSGSRRCFRFCKDV